MKRLWKNYGESEGGANKPGGKRARERTSQGQTGKGAKKPDTL